MSNVASSLLSLLGNIELHLFLFLGNELGRDVADGLSTCLEHENEYGVSLRPSVNCNLREVSTEKNCRLLPGSSSSAAAPRVFRS